jgi:predicted lipoprotein with Yx(FWY)xxD motif
MTKRLTVIAVAVAIVPAAAIGVAQGAVATAQADQATTPSPNGPSRCYGDCAAAWPVYFAKGTLKAGAGVKQSLIGTTRRRDGRRQVTYNGWPLYYYAHENAGEVKCQNVETHGGTWLVVRAAGTPVR